MTDPEKQIDRINDISAIARTSWLALLGYLAFIGISLLAVEDADFFVETRRTDLPLVGVAIPTLLVLLLRADPRRSALRLPAGPPDEALGRPTIVAGRPLGERCTPGSPTTTRSRSRATAPCARGRCVGSATLPTW